MKRITVWLLAAVLLLSFLLPTACAETEPVKLTPAQEALIAYAEAMYARGSRVQYDDTRLVPSDKGNYKRWHIRTTVAEAYTSQYTAYTNCAAFCYDVYYFTLGLKIRHYDTKNLIKTDDETRVLYHKVTGSETAAEKAELQKQFLETLQPCDIITYRYNNDTRGHALFYTGNNRIIHSTAHGNEGGGSYNYEKRVEHSESNGSIELLDVNRFFEADYDRNLLGGKVTQYAIIRPLLKWSGEVPAESLNRVKNLKGVLAEKLCSRTIGQTVEPGEELTYTFSLRNDNKEPVTLEIKDAVPAHTTFVSGCENVSGASLSWTVTVPAGKTQTVSYTVRADDDALPDGKTAIVSDKGTVGGVTCRCPAVYLGRHLNAGERKKITEAASAESALSGWDRAAEICRAAGLDLKSLLPSPQEVLASLYPASEEIEKHNTLSDASPYYKTVAPTMFGGRVVLKSELYGGVRTSGPLLRQLETGDLVVCTDETEKTPADADLTIWMLADGDAVLPLTGTDAGRLLRGDAAQKLLDTAISYQKFAVLRPAALRQQDASAGGAFTDAASIAQIDAEAVEILSRLKILSGFPDGTFRPNDTLTRAQAAKILCVLSLGTKSADAISATGSTFSDVPATHWSNKYVEYCASKGVVAGVGNGRFNPDGKLTGHAFGKMLLVALGEDPAGLTGKDWDKNTERLLKAKHLNYGVAVDGNGLDRQSACRLALNALFDGEDKSPSSTLAQKVFGVEREEIGVHGVYYCRPVKAYYSRSADEYWPGSKLELTASPVYIHPTGPITGGDFVGFLGVKKLTAEQLNVYHSGLHWAAKAARAKDIWHEGSKAFYELSGDGIRLEFYYDARKGVCTVLHIPTFCAKITAASAPVRNADGTVKEHGSVTFEGCAPCESDAFLPSDVGSYGLYRGNAEKDWRICTKPVEAIRGKVLTGKLTAYEPMVQVTIDGKAYRYPYQDLVARGAEKVVFEDDAKIGDVLHALIDENGFCYAVWK